MTGLQMLAAPRDPRTSMAQYLRQWGGHVRFRPFRELSEPLVNDSFENRSAYTHVEACLAEHGTQSVPNPSDRA